MSADPTPRPNQTAGDRLAAALDERGLVLAGYAIIVAFVALFFGWGSLVPLASAAIAPGTVGVVGDKKLVQHPVGGVVAEIRARDGDRVAAGEVLIVLDAVETAARHAELEGEWVERTAERLRHEAALADDAGPLALPPALATDPLAARLEAALAHQRAVLEARAGLLERGRTRLRRALETIDAESRAAAALVGRLDERLALVDAERERYRRLAEDGIATRRDTFEIERDRSALLGEIETARATIDVAAKRRATLAAEIAELEGTAMNEAALGADAARREADGLAERLAATGAELERMTIRAPIAGTVTASTATTIGGVVAAGEPIMEIVPGDGRLLVESRVDPKDRDAVRLGQSASVRFSAFDRRSSRPADGTVVLISADRLLDPVTAAPYFRTLVALDDPDAAAPPGKAVVPGMQADVLIATGERTLLDYLLAPVTRSFDRAFRED